MQQNLIVKGAREHNLKNITVEIPRNKLTVITGLSGSGKSTLAFDTIYAEGQRRYVESLSAYARQFLGLMEKPDVDSIEGLSPAISIEQKTTSKNPRSTVGTVTEIYDYLRLLYARVGTPHCPECNATIQPQSAQNIIELVMAEKDKTRIILAPIIRGKKGTYEKVFEQLIKDGFAKVRVNGTIYNLDTIKDELKLKRYEKHYIEAVLDKVTITEDERTRISDAIEQAITYTKGTVIITQEQTQQAQKKGVGKNVGETIYSTHGACPNHPKVVFEELQPRMFSFNSPFGACQTCLGLGVQQKFDPDLILPDKELSIADGAIKTWKGAFTSWRIQQLAPAARKYGIDIFKPIRKLKAEQLDVILYGTPEGTKKRQSWEGVINMTERLYKQTDSNSRKEFMQRFQTSLPCPTCKGKRLNKKILGVRIANKNIIQITDLSIKDILEFFNQLKLTQEQMTIAKQVLKEIKERVGFLYNVGVGYLTLSRTAATLSGGEAQRIRLATQIGANLMGVMYILDEPSIGLHQRDNEKLIKTLQKLRDVGNTVIVVEHDEDTMRAADHLIDMGPGAGRHGGHIVAQGTPQQVTKNSKSTTGQYLKGQRAIRYNDKKRAPKDWIKIYGAKQNNLKDVDVEIPTGVFCCVTGVSGSGKSTLINEILYKGLARKFYKSRERPGKHKKITAPVDKVIVIDQSPIGRTPRSNPATYTKVFDDIRKLFAQTKEAKARGYKEGRFSFNVKGGRCEKCRGEGQIKIEMNFLPDIYIKCEECKGSRYNKETMQVTYKHKNIGQVLSMDVEEALEFFANIPSIKRKLQTLFDVGLGYIDLGQSSVTLSGGEAQRIKLTRELAKVAKGNTLYILDEPTTGLHFEDVNRLLGVLNRLVEKEHTILVIEHNLDVIKNADYIIDIGPEGGEEGGQIIAQGTPQQVSKSKKSYTGQFLKRALT